MLDPFLRSVTKDSYGPVPSHSKTHAQVAVHRFHDAFSVFHWGKMPDVLQGRGQLNALVFSFLNSQVQSEAAWKEFLRSPDALTFRKAASSIPQSGNVSSMLNELAETFPVRSNYLGCVDEGVFQNMRTDQAIDASAFFSGDWSEALKTALEPKSALYPVCGFDQEEKVPVSSVMGRTVWDYSYWKKQTVRRVLPFEFRCHFSLTESALGALNPHSLALPKTASISTLKAGSDWDFPLIELVLTQDPHLRRIDFSEALWITGFSPEQLQKNILTAAWTAAFVRARAQKAKLKLRSVALRFTSDSVLYDSLSLDDLDFDGFHHDEALNFYRKTSWFEALEHAKKHFEASGLPEWKRLCVEPAPWLDPKIKQDWERDLPELATRLVVGA